MRHLEYENRTYVIPTEIDEEWRLSIKRGMAFLDEYFDTDRWALEISLEALDLADTKTCVCGQLFESYAEQERQENGASSGFSGYDWALQYVIERGPREDKSEVSASSAAEFGFYVPGEVSNEGDDGEFAYELIEDANPGQLPPSAWELFTQYWAEAITERKADLT